MSTKLPEDPATFAAEVFPRYAKSTGPDRYARFIEEVLDLQRTYVQDRILAALHEHDQVVVAAANGVGKSYIAAAGGVAALHCNPDTIVNVTAGTSGTLKTNIWKPARSLYRGSILPELFGGRTMDGDREIRTGLDDEWFFECVSPRYPDDLEGPHNDHVIYIIEEADKPGVTDEHIDSVRSTATDADDRILVIANPPDGSGNVVSKLIQNDQWHHLQFPTWDCHNVRVERGLEEGNEIGGLATAYKLKQDWREYHDEPWPGLEQAIEWSDPWLGADLADRSAVLPDDRSELPNDAFREDLHSLWYRRRCGIVPPGGASVLRPIEPGDVRAAYDRQPGQVRETPQAVGIDVARTTDNTVMLGVHDLELRVHYAEQGDNHEEQKPDVVGGTDTTPGLAEWPAPDVAVDKGYAPGFHDYVNDRCPNVVGFQNGTKPVAGTRWYDKWAEALHHLGEFLEAGGSIASQQLRKEALAAARVVQYEERTLDSRGKNGAEVYQATSKDAIKDELGHSPDYLDAALMAVWRDRADPDDQDDRSKILTF
ncbi:hypothetical protein [Haloarcula pelagica]|uniref:hypothetical protein n=1 Tax=Haloarcula pelagica TaxID=3033389 RepID=UPI0024C3D8EC|nr:hypothetical protein [Halomicroarcula sp. YJ-61-S]